MSGNILDRVFFRPIKEPNYIKPLAFDDMRDMYPERLDAPRTFLEQAQIFWQHNQDDKDWRTSLAFKTLFEKVAEVFPAGIPIYYEDETTQMSVYEVRAIDSQGEGYSRIIVSQFVKTEGQQEWYRAEYQGPAKTSRSYDDW